jgi:hypothetical protein
MAIERIRDAIALGKRGLVSDEEFAWFYRGLPVDLVARIRRIPNLCPESFEEWKAVIGLFVRVPRVESAYIPGTWKRDKKASADKTYWSFVDDRLGNGIKILCPGMGK